MPRKLPKIPGVRLIEHARHSDERGFFQRLLESDEAPGFDEWSLSYNETAGTLRGLHYQSPPYAQTKLIFVTQGHLMDVVVDLRPDSPAYGTWESFELRADVPQVLYIPAGCAHGFQTLVPRTTLLYAMQGAYVPESATGIRWDDPTLGIAWPLAVAVMSEKDRELPLLT